MLESEFSGPGATDSQQHVLFPDTSIHV